MKKVRLVLRSADLCSLRASFTLQEKQLSLSIYLFALPATSSNFSSEVDLACGLFYYLAIVLVANGLCAHC